MRKAVSGPMRGTRLQTIPSQMVQLDPYLEKHPQAKVLSKETGYNRNYEKTPYSGYADKNEVFFPISELDRTYHLKTWTLAIPHTEDPEKKTLLVPSKELESQSYSFQANDQAYKIVFNSESNNFSCKKPQGISCIQGYWFALRGFHPKAEVIEP